MCTWGLNRSAQYAEPKWMLKVVVLLASSQSSGHIIWKHYGSLWRINKMLKMSGINNVLRGSSCFGKMGVPFSTMLHFVSNILFPNGALLLALNWLIQWSSKCEITKLPSSWPAIPPQSPYQLKPESLFVQWGDSQALNIYSWMNILHVSFLSFHSLLFFVLLSFFLCLPASASMKERNICSRPKGDTLNTSSFL